MSETTAQRVAKAVLELKTLSAGIRVMDHHDQQMVMLKERGRSELDFPRPEEDSILVLMRFTAWRDRLMKMMTRRLWDMSGCTAQGAKSDFTRGGLGGPPGGGQSWAEPQE